MAANPFYFESGNPACEKDKFFAELRNFASAARWSAPISNEIELILEEWWTNLVNYAFVGVSHPIVSVRIESNATSATVEIRDNGIAFDPTSRPDPNLNLPIEDRPIGGLGVYMIKKLSSSVKSERKDQRNVLLIEKDLTRPVLGGGRK